MVISGEWSFGVCEEGNDGQEVIRVTISGWVWAGEDVYEEGSDGEDRGSAEWSSVGNGVLECRRRAMMTKRSSE